MSSHLPAALFRIALAPSVADDIAEGCKAFAAENGTDASGCNCLGAAAAEDDTLFEALLTIEAADDMEALKPDHRAAVDACFPTATDEAAQAGDDA